MRELLVLMLLTVMASGCSSASATDNRLRLDLTEGTATIAIAIDSRSDGVTAFLDVTAPQYWIYLADAATVDAASTRFTATCIPDGRWYSTAAAPGQRAGLFYRNRATGLDCYDPSDGQVNLVRQAGAWLLRFSATCNGVAIRGTAYSN